MDDNKEHLNNDGVVNDTTAYIGDLDGWANYQELLVPMVLKAVCLDEQFMRLYYSVAGGR